MVTNKKQSISGTSFNVSEYSLKENQFFAVIGESNDTPDLEDLSFLRTTLTLQTNLDQSFKIKSVVWTQNFGVLLTNLTADNLTFTFNRFSSEEITTKITATVTLYDETTYTVSRFLTNITSNGEGEENPGEGGPEDCIPTTHNFSALHTTYIGPGDYKILYKISSSGILSNLQVYDFTVDEENSVNSPAYFFSQFLASLYRNELQELFVFNGNGGTGSFNVYTSYPNFSIYGVSKEDADILLNTSVYLYTYYDVEMFYPETDFMGVTFEGPITFHSCGIRTIAGS